MSVNIQEGNINQLIQTGPGYSLEKIIYNRRLYPVYIERICLNPYSAAIVADS